MDYADLLVLPVARGFAFARASLLTATISGSASLANVTGPGGKRTILISAVSLASDQVTRTCPIFLLSSSLPYISVITLPRSTHHLTPYIALWTIALIMVGVPHSTGCRTCIRRKVKVSRSGL